MQEKLRIWLVTNDASGSNAQSALEDIARACDGCGLTIAGRSAFPAQQPPSFSQLADAQADILAIFAGDGTVNAVLTAMAGWSGAVLVLPGGTMNLLFHRLFGDLTLEQVLAAVSAGRVHRRRPGIAASSLGCGYAEVMAGPGTAWSDVREAMRTGNLLEMAAQTRTAVVETVAGDMVACTAPPVGRAEGYPLLLLAAEDERLRLIAYHAQTTGEMIEHAAALAARDFRSGPHEVLALGAEFTLGAPAGGGFGVLLDGEQAQANGSVRFSLARCEVDLLATRLDG